MELALGATGLAASLRPLKDAGGDELEHHAATGHRPPHDCQDVRFRMPTRTTRPGFATPRLTNSRQFLPDGILAKHRTATACSMRRSDHPSVRVRGFAAVCCRPR